MAASYPVGHEIGRPAITSLPERLVPTSLSASRPSCSDVSGLTDNPGVIGHAPDCYPRPAVAVDWRAVSLVGLDRS
jgi:hypothetical protein